MSDLQPVETTPSLSDQSPSNQPSTAQSQSNDNDEAKQPVVGLVTNQSTSLDTPSANPVNSNTPVEIVDPFQLPELEEDPDVVITGSVLKPAKPKVKKSSSSKTANKSSVQSVLATAAPLDIQPSSQSESAPPSSSTQSTSSSLNQAIDIPPVFSSITPSRPINHNLVPKATHLNSRSMVSSGTSGSNKQSNNQQRSANPAPDQTEVTVLPGTMPVTALDYVNHSSDQQQSRNSDMNQNQQNNQSYQNFPSQPGYPSQPPNQQFNQQQNMNQFNNNYGQLQQDHQFNNQQFNQQPNQQFNQQPNQQFNQPSNNFPNQLAPQQLPAVGGRQPMFQWHEEQIVALASQVAKLERAVETLNTENMNYVNENLRLVFENRRLLLLEKHLTEHISKLEYDMITSGAIQPDTEDQMYWMDERLRTDGARLRATQAKYAANKRPRVAAASTVHLNPPVQPAGPPAAAVPVAAVPIASQVPAACASPSAPVASLPTTAPVAPASARRPATAATHLSG